MPAIPLRELIENPHLLDEFFEKHRDHCAYCKIPLQGFITGRNKCPKGVCCDDCYYEKLGEEIEKHPICSPRVRRG